MSPRKDGVTCIATSKQTGKPCQQAPSPGATVCRFHGGAAGRLRAKIAREAAEAKARQALALLDVAPVEDPLSELSRLAGQVVAFKDQMARMVNQLEDRIRYEDVKGSEQLRSEV